MRLRGSLAARLTFTLLLLLVGFGVLVASLSHKVIREYQDEELQRLSHGLAQHIVEHWPEIAAPDRDTADREARQALLSMLMTVNPGVQVYLLDADGKVNAYIGEPGMVRREQIDLSPVRRFLSGAPLPIRATDPMGSSTPRLFSAAMFPPQAGDLKPPGYLYIVLNGAAWEKAAEQLGSGRAWRVAIIIASVGMLGTLVVGALAFRWMTLPLDRLARRMRAYSARSPRDERRDRRSEADEVQAIAAAFGDMTARIEAQAARERAQATEHRETIAGVAHDLRTPLTALHGHLEMLFASSSGHDSARERVLATALAQSDKVRRLSHQLFELATLQAGDQTLSRECFSLDELVMDAVQKFEFSDQTTQVQLSGPAPGRIELVGDLHLVERALTNLIDNAVRYAGGADPVQVSLRQIGQLAEIVVEDTGPGLPEEILERLASGQSVREPPIKRTGGGIGGLGLAIAQRVAVLHGGGLRALPTNRGGTRLCMALAMGQPDDLAA